MDTPFQLFMKIQRQLEELQTMNTLARKWLYILDKYNQEAFDWYDFEVDCDHWYQYWYMDTFHL
jgi:hypothetical protein